jgi:hypothetical protein
VTASAVADHPAPPPVTTGRDREHYEYPPTGVPLVRVSKILSSTTSEAYLAGWYGNTAAYWVFDHMAEIGALLKAGQREEALELVGGAAKRVTELKSDTGTHVHAVVEALIRSAAAPDGAGAAFPWPVLPPHLHGALYDDDPIEDVIAAMCDGFLNFVSDWDPQILFSEMTVYNLALGVAGTLDMIVLIRDAAISADGTRLVRAPGKTLILVIDVKTGKHYKVTWREQITTYRRMPECEPVRGQGLYPMPPADACAVLHLRKNFRRGYRVHLISGRSEAAAWNRFRRRCEIYFGLKAEPDKPGPVVYPPRADGTMQSPYITDLDGEGYGRLIGPLTEAFGDDVTVADLARFTDADLLKVKGIGKVAVSKTIPQLIRAYPPDPKAA